MAKLFYIVLIVLIVIVVVGYFAYQNYRNSITQKFLSMVKSEVDSFNVYKVNDCEIIMKQQNLTSALCTMLSNGNIVLRDNNLNCGVQFGTVNSCAIGNFNTKFNPGDYIGLQVNLQKLNTFYPTYYACIEIGLPIYETAYPSQYGSVSTAGQISNSQFFCSGLLNESDYHHVALSAFVLNQAGSYTIMKIWVFDGNLGNIDFKNNLDKGQLVFNMQGEVV